MAVDYINNMCKSSAVNKLGKGETNKKNQRFGRSGGTKTNTNQELGKSDGMKNNKAGKLSDGIKDAKYDGKVNNIEKEMKGRQMLRAKMKGNMVPASKRHNSKNNVVQHNTKSNMKYSYKSNTQLNTNSKHSKPTKGITTEAVETTSHIEKDEQYGLNYLWLLLHPEK